MNLSLTDFLVIGFAPKPIVLNGRRIYSTIRCHAKMNLCWYIAVNIFQIDVKAAKTFDYVSPNSVTF